MTIKYIQAALLALFLASCGASEAPQEEDGGLGGLGGEGGSGGILSDGGVGGQGGLGGSGGLGGTGGHDDPGFSVTFELFTDAGEVVSVYRDRDNHWELGIEQDTGDCFSPMTSQEMKRLRINIGMATDAPW